MKKKPINLLSEAQAKILHSSGKPYTVLIDSDKEPTCFIEVIKDKKMVGVGFLDEQQKEYLMYQFQLLESGRLFLSMAVYREFAEHPGEGAGILNVAHGTTYLFDEDGKTVVREEKFNPYTLEESQTIADVTGNYDVFPEFGEYDSLIRKER
ncbi:hypothetical protein [Lelliottia amnigena]|uniref:hypothetical protein n=1 Tax=Lelliottia amnigena TaxID=61646 RepID=UPI002B22AA3D|nr:hypothetical protein [Lelliottia amnigena]MEA9396577.1 hypothetical protein [Lelliottia amnigena]